MPGRSAALSPSFRQLKATDLQDLTNRDAPRMAGKPVAFLGFPQAVFGRFRDHGALYLQIVRNPSVNIAR